MATGAIDPLAIVPTEAEADTGRAVTVLVGRVRGDALTLDGAVAAWLHETLQRSQSQRTVHVYSATLADCRAELARGGLDLDTADERAVALLLQAWAARARARDGQPVSGSTFNLRLAAVSSFYQFARRYGLEARDPESGARVPIGNPTTLVRRAMVHAYAGAQPLDPHTVTERLAKIDGATPAGLRDRALLTLALTTGRRAAELAALTWGDITLAGGNATITWRRTKGGKTAYDQLDGAVTDAILQWLYAAYGRDLGTLPHEAPLWLALSRNTPKGKRQAMTVDAISDIYVKRLGVAKIHVTRHTFAEGMRRAGADVTTIQARLGHSSLDTTSHYLRALDSAVNPYAAQLAALFGLAPEPAPEPHRAKTTRPLHQSGGKRKG